MSLTMGWKFGEKLAEIMGLPPENVADISLFSPADDVVAVEATLVVTEEQVEEILRLIRENSKNILFSVPITVATESGEVVEEIYE